MTITEDTAYPGSRASAQEIALLAIEYQRAAQTLLANGRKGEAISRAPYRLCAIHAVELYLNAFLLSVGEKPEQIRSRHHNLAERTSLAIAHGLKLRKKTADHLTRMTEAREYLVSRYDPGNGASLSEVNRLTATLEEIAEKVRKAVLGVSS